MVAKIAFRRGSGAHTITPPAGWASIVRVDYGLSVVAESFWKIAGTTGTDPGPYVFTFDLTRTAAGGIASYGAVDATTPINAFGGRARDGSEGPGNLASPSITTTVPNTMLVAFFSVAGTGAISPPARMTEQYDVTTSSGNGVTAEVADAIQAAPGATGTHTAMFSTDVGSGAGGVSHLIALSPRRPKPRCRPRLRRPRKPRRRPRVRPPR